MLFSFVVLVILLIAVGRLNINLIFSLPASLSDCQLGRLLNENGVLCFFHIYLQSHFVFCSHENMEEQLLFRPQQVRSGFCYQSISAQVLPASQTNPSMP